MKLRRLLLPLFVFVTVGFIHFVWSGVFPERNATQDRWQTVVTEESVSWFNRYWETQSYWLGYSYALSLAFVAVAARRYREQRMCAARNLAVGGITLTGFLAVAGCFLIGCCGSPMLGVYLSLFGASFLPFANPLIAVLTTALIAASYWWMRSHSRKDRQPPNLTGNTTAPACDCNGPANEMPATKIPS
jgi:hypothetical protein